MIRLAIVLGALCISACSSLPASAVAQEPIGEGAERVIHVDASATIRRVPDRAVVQLAVETVTATAEQATRQNAATMDRVLTAVRRLGIDPAMIRTSRVELFPRYDRPVEGQQPRITGYTARNQVTVTVDSVPLVGPLVDAAVAAGANRVTGINFQLRDPEAAHQEALRLAIARARRQAQVVADALGERLGPPLRVSTSAWQPPFRTMARADVMMEAARPAPAPTPVEPGELDVQANVSITFRIGT